LSGFLSVVVDSNRPRFLGPALADAITGLYAAYGVLGALVDDYIHDNTAGATRTGAGAIHFIVPDEPPLSAGTPILNELVQGILGIFIGMRLPLRIGIINSIGRFVVFVLKGGEEFAHDPLF